MKHNIHDDFSHLLKLLPKDTLRFSFEEVIGYLENSYGSDVYTAFDPQQNIAAPTKQLPAATWLKTAKTVGVNVRTIQHFWNLIPYAVTLPKAFNGIHILPVWEPGVVASLYGPASWNINPEFFSPTLHSYFPTLDTVEKQLKVVINVLHLMGKSVGMDVVPHTDRFSEMVIANPICFEWLQRDDLIIIRQDNDLYQSVERIIYNYVLNTNSGRTLPEKDAFFYKISENERLQLLFGEKYDYSGRLERRKEVIRLLYEQGFETAPATMGPPYRGLEVDPNPEARVTDDEGLIWRDYRIMQPQTFSRAFGPLARYRLYWSKDNNRNWELDFTQPNHAAWEYVVAHYRAIKTEFDFDFMRGDMSHVQMRPYGVPPQPDAYYDLLGAVKADICREFPSFGYFAESFLAPPGVMAYGDECDHLEAALADSTLGDLQSEPIGTEKFVKDFAQYRKWLETRQFAPNFTVMTADKDDPRFDAFYLKGNEIRYFMALFLTDMPAYVGLGFECRDPHPTPAPNEHYTKMYVFQMPDGPKGTSGPYVWGENQTLYFNLCRQKILAEEIFSSIENARVQWLLAPDENGQRRVVAWTQAEQPAYLFVANMDPDHASTLRVPFPEGNWQLIFSTSREHVNGNDFSGSIGAGEGLVWRKENA